MILSYQIRVGAKRQKHSMFYSHHAMIDNRTINYTTVHSDKYDLIIII
jgi:hypothetical protein